MCGDGQRRLVFARELATHRNTRHHPRLTRQMRFAVVSLLWFGATEIALGEPTLFTDSKVINAVLTAPMAQIRAQRKQEPPLYLPARIAITNDDGMKEAVPVKLRARGNFRRRNCANPPLKLNFKKGDVKGTVFRGQDKLKLVRPCRNGKIAEQLVMLEYLAYQIYATLTPESFRVRPLRMSFIDVEERQKPQTTFGFLIEDDTELAKRTGRKLIQVAKITSSALDRQSTTTAELFQFMIGNNDYSLLRGPQGDRCCHNVSLLSEKGDLGVTPVPYDFDFSGLVDAWYAEPPSQLKIRSVRTRYFRGHCVDEGQWAEARTLYNDKRTAIYELFAVFSGLDERRKTRSLDYLDGFYEILNDPKLFERAITRRCR